MMITLFFLILTLILFVYFGYPTTLWVLSFVKKRSPKKADITPKVSIVIPAHNEEGCIGEKINNCLELCYPKDRLEVIVGSDGSTDATNSIVKEYEEKGIVLYEGTKRMGKCSVLRRCIEMATGEIIFFTDADATLEKNALKKVVENFADLHIGCVEGVRRDINEKGLLLDSLYWKYETMIKKLNSKLHAILGATGAIFAIRKDLYQPIDDQRGDDFEIPIRVRLQGSGAVLEPDALAYHPWLSNKDEFGRIVRIVSWMLPSALILLIEAIQKKNGLLIFQLIFHKILRWSIPFLMILLFIVNLQLTGYGYRLFLWIQAMFYLFAFLGLICEKTNLKMSAILKVPYFFCLINFASLVGILKASLGRIEMNWKKTARDKV